MANDISHKDRHTVPKGFRNEGEKCVSKRRAKEGEKKPANILKDRKHIQPVCQALKYAETHTGDAIQSSTAVCKKRAVKKKTST